LLTRRPPTAPLFPYTTLFRSVRIAGAARGHGGWRTRRRGFRAYPGAAHGGVRRRNPDSGPELARPPEEGRRPAHRLRRGRSDPRSEEHTSELQSLAYLVCRLL